MRREEKGGHGSLLPSLPIRSRLKRGGGGKKGGKGKKKKYTTSLPSPILCSPSGIKRKRGLGGKKRGRKKKGAPKID